MTADFFKQKFGYEIDGVWFPRVTSITSPFQKKWFGSFGAAAWGTSMHETIEALLKGERVLFDPKAATAIQTFQEWQKVYPLRILDPQKDIERRVVNLEQGYAGTIDMVAEVDGVFGIIDLKTSTSILREHAIQTAAYFHAYNATKVVQRACETRWILRIDQYQECRGCFAKSREKYGAARISGGKEVCNHQWAELKGEIEFKELPGADKDFEDFLGMKERWEWANKEWLDKIPNYEKNIRQYTLL